jgi:hypothetical protein
LTWGGVVDNNAAMTQPFFNQWMDRSQPESAVTELVVLKEKKEVDEAVEAAVRQAALDHLVGLEILERIGGYPEATAFIRNKIPSDRRVRSGDLGEILASEYIDQCTDFEVPIKRLRWKDDRNTTMRGNDVLGICHSSKCRLLKAESKSRARLSASVVDEAISGLQQHSGRPNPSSLAFISARLRESGDDKKAELFEKIQSGKLKPDGIEHLVFTFSGNDPTEHLRKHIADRKSPKRHLVGCRVEKHQEFIKRTFESLNAPKCGRSR